MQSILEVGQVFGFLREWTYASVPERCEAFSPKGWQDLDPSDIYLKNTIAKLFSASDEKDRIQLLILWLEQVILLGPAGGDEGQGLEQARSKPHFILKTLGEAIVRAIHHEKDRAYLRVLLDSAVTMSSPYPTLRSSGIYYIHTLSHTNPEKNLVDNLNASLRTLSSLLASGCARTQLRIKGVTYHDFLESVSKLEECYRDVISKCIVNDWAEACFAYPFEGAHLGKSDGTFKDIPRELQSKFIFGRSTNTIDEWHRAAKEGWDYISLGPIFESKTKSGHAAALGLESVRKLMQERQKFDHPELCVIGGIDTHDQVFQLAALGVDWIACSSSIQKTKEPAVVFRHRTFAYEAGRAVYKLK